MRCNESPSDFSEGWFPFTAVLTLDPVDGGTKYTATVIHANEADRATHDDSHSR